MTDADDRLRHALDLWGAWFNAGGCGDGFPRMSIIHPQWMPPAAGKAAMLPTATHSDLMERQVHAAIGKLSDKLLIVVVGKWARRMSSAQMALELCVTSSAVDGRLLRARLQLGQALRLNLA